MTTSVLESLSGIKWIDNESAAKPAESSFATATSVTRESHCGREEEGQVELARSGQVTFHKHDSAEAGGIPEPHRPRSRDVGTRLVTRGGRSKGQGARGKYECEKA